MEHRGYTVLKGFVDACDFLSSSFENQGASSSFPQQILKELFTSEYNEFTGEGALCAEEGCNL